MKVKSNIWKGVFAGVLAVVGIFLVGSLLSYYSETGATLLVFSVLAVPGFVGGVVVKRCDGTNKDVFIVGVCIYLLSIVITVLLGSTTIVNDDTSGVMGFIAFCFGIFNVIGAAVGGYLTKSKS